MPTAALVTTGSVLTATEYNYLPRGIIVRAERTTDQTGITTVTDITSLTATWTANSTRIYRTTVVTANCRQVTTTANAKIIIADGSNVQKTQALETVTAGNFFHVIASLTETGLSGSVTRKARAETSAGTLEVLSGATYPSFIVVEDLGQA